MKNVEIKTYAIKESLISSIIFFIIGIVLFTNPNGIITFVVYALGIILILLGIFKLLVYYKTIQFQPNKKEIISGMIYMLIGMVTIICGVTYFNALETVFRIALSAYLMYVGITRLISAFKANKKQRISLLIVSLLIIGVSIALALLNGLTFKFVGLFIILYSVIEICGYIFSTRNKKEASIEEATIINEEAIKDENELLIEHKDKKKKFRK